VEAAEELVEKCDVDSTFADLCLDGKQVPSDKIQVLVTLRIVVVEKLLAKVVAVFPVRSRHVSILQREAFAHARAARWPERAWLDSPSHRRPSPLHDFPDLPSSLRQRREDRDKSCALSHIADPPFHASPAC